MYKHEYRADIDGLRAIAVLSVIFYHLDISLVSGGYIGVDIFFVISGFVITSQIYRQYSNNNFSVLDFYYRRVKRILPAIYFLLIYCSIFSVFTLYPSDYKKFFSAAKQVVLFIPNIYFSRNTDYFEPANDTSPLLHTWSLGVEEQLYLLYPIFLVSLLKRGVNKQLVVNFFFIFITSFLFNCYLTKYHPNQAFYMLYARAWEFLIGGMLAFGVIPKFQNRFLITSMAFMGVVLIFFSILFLDKHSIFPGINALYPCLGTGLIIYSCSKENLISRALSTKFLNFTGLISYSLYLWHWPIIIFYKLLSGYEITLGSAFLLLSATYLIAYISWRYIEQPFRSYNQISKISRYIEKIVKKDLYILNKQVIISYAVLCILLLPVGFELLQRNNKANWRIYEADFGADKNYKPLFISETENYQVLLLGDSHAVHYFPAVQKWANTKNMHAKIFAAQACPSVLVDYITNDRPHTIAACKEHIKSAINIINSNKEIKYVFLASRQDKYTRNSADLNKFKSALSATVKLLTDKNIQVVILDQVPFFKSSPNYTTLWDKLFDSSRQNNEFANIDYNFINYKLGASRQVIQEIVQEYRISYYDPLEHITKASHNGKAIFSDDNHLNPYGTVVLAENFEIS